MATEGAEKQSWAVVAPRNPAPAMQKRLPLLSLDPKTKRTLTAGSSRRALLDSDCSQRAKVQDQLPPTDYKLLNLGFLVKLFDISGNRVLLLTS